MRSFEEYRHLFADLYEAVKLGHLASARQHQGHGLDHDVAVAQMTARIAPDQRTADKAWAAALIHSTDRVVEEGQLETILRQYLRHLPAAYFTAEELEEIFVAVMRHGEKNKDDDSLTLQVLKDADRLINLELLVTIRGAQFYPNIPAIELEHIGHKNPKSTYKGPCNSLDNMRTCLEWVEWIRLPKAKERVRKSAQRLEQFIEDCEAIYHELGLAGVKL
jgi:hypothetical protein